jgi:hypothetical protein
LGHRLLYEVKVSPDDRPQFLAATMLARLLSNAQGSILMTERGLSVEARTLARSALETVFVISAVANEPKAIDKLVDAEHRNRRMVARVLSASTHLDEEHQAAIATLLNGPPGNRFDVYEIAKIANLQDTYDVLYRDLSHDVHASIGALERYAKSDAEGNIVGLEYGPGNIDVPNCLLPVLFSMLIGFSRVAEVLSISKFAEMLSNFKTQYDDLLSKEPHQ